MMPIGPILLTILIILIHFGLADRVLSRLLMSRREAMLLAALALLGLPFNLEPLPGLRLNIGALVVPGGVAFFYLASSRSLEDTLRTVIGAGVAAAAIHQVSGVFPPGEPTELNFYSLDAQYLYAIIAGLIGALMGRSYRGAFAASVLGVILGDLLYYTRRLYDRLPPPAALPVGGGGFWGTALAAGVLALVAVHWIGTPMDAASGSPVSGRSGSDERA